FTQAVEALLFIARAQRGDGEDLRLPAREDRRAVRAREESHLAADRADLIQGTAVRALLLVQVERPDLLLGDLVYGLPQLSFPLGEIRGEAGDDLLIQVADRGLACCLVRVLDRLADLALGRLTDRSDELLVHEMERHFGLSRAQLARQPFVEL